MRAHARDGVDTTTTTESCRNDGFGVMDVGVGAVDVMSDSGVE